MYRTSIKIDNEMLSETQFEFSGRLSATGAGSQQLGLTSRWTRHWRVSPPTDWVAQ